eukprot:TRINITY_DN1500_c0_g1_i1.p1 TRINITY_DN1500_c0_g1~~TRINITY_DN1500_c0_g1_i1.p1  ORF type:complete len:321 (-),score=43.01 TRINITY_DN1500_c0_g1_i1:59-1021(-)
MKSVVFLGTSSGIPTKDRNVSSIALIHKDKKIWLFDCGDGTQIQMIRKGLVFMRIHKIFITHLHGDHCYGLPGVLAMLSMKKVTHPIELFGPKGIKEFIMVQSNLTQSHYSYPLNIVEFDGPTDLRISNNSGGGGGDDDDDFYVGNNNFIIELFARPLTHRVPCFGYTLKQLPVPGNFDGSKAVALGVPKSLIPHLRKNKEITLDTGVVVKASDCLRMIEGKKITILGDTSDSSQIADVSHGSDLLIHESTFDAKETERALKTGHSTSRMAGSFAKQIAAKKLVITHFSARYEPGAEITVEDNILKEVQSECPLIQVYQY